MEIGMFTCFIRYQIDPDKLDNFREYAHSWISLIRKYDGIHHGYFLPGKEGVDIPEAMFSFPGLGIKGPPNIAVALFSFPNIEAYDKYLQDVDKDEACKVATNLFGETKCFLSYERTFLVPMFE
jgi:hypothetical protein